MIERSYIKEKSKKQLKGMFWKIAIIILVAQIISNMDMLNFEFYSFDNEKPSALFRAMEICSFLLTGVMSFGLCKFSLNVIHNRDEAKFTDIFYGFSIYLKTLGLYIIVTLVTMLGSVLLIVPGIIVSLMFSQAYYILAEDDEKSIITCLRESSEIMKGHKWELFKLQLSFIGWVIVVALTLGLAAIWVEPYAQLTFANYYVCLKNNGQMDMF